MLKHICLRIRSLQEKCIQHLDRSPDQDQASKHRVISKTQDIVELDTANKTTFFLIARFSINITAKPFGHP